MNDTLQDLDQKVVITYERFRTDGSVKCAKVIDPLTKWNYEETKTCTIRELITGSQAEKVLAAEMGYGLDTLIQDDNEFVRAAVARKGHRLDILVHDISHIVRTVVAEAGYGWSILLNDSNPYVRGAVIEAMERQQETLP